MTSVAFSEPARTTLELLRGIAAKPALHARLLNTVSMLEYVGARKIMKSQRADEFDMNLLTHVTEETRHAWLVKRMAQRLDPTATETYGLDCLLCGEEAEAYIQDLDTAAEKELTESPMKGSIGWLNYLYTSLLIEERADLFYGAYEKVLEEIGLGGALKALIKDESKHLVQVASKIEEVDPGGGPRLERLREVERAGFGAFEDALWGELQRAQAKVG